MQSLSWSAERGMSDGSGVVFDLPRCPLDTEKSCLVKWHDYDQCLITTSDQL